MNIGRRFKIYRERKGLSQKEAAEALGINAYQIANYETNRSEPNIETLKKMSKLYRVSLDMLLGNGKLFEQAESIREDEVDHEDFRKKIENLLRDFDQMHRGSK